jgi:hypothetical protein
MLSAEIAVLNDAEKLPGIAFGISLRWASQLGLPISVKSLHGGI